MADSEEPTPAIKDIKDDVEKEEEEGELAPTTTQEGGGEDDDGADDTSPLDDDEDADDDDDMEDEMEEMPSDTELSTGSGEEESGAMGAFGGNFEDVIYSKADLSQILNVPAAVESAPAIELKIDYATQEEKFKDFENIYGKLLKAEKKKEEGQLTSGSSNENLYDAMQSNFLKTMARTFLYRLVMTGTHNENMDGLVEWFKDMIEDINVHCYSEIITGVLVLYPKHFIHVLEGSEDTLMRFMTAAADQFEPTGLDWKLEFRAVRGIKVREPILFTTVKTFVIGAFRIKHRGMLSGWKTERISPSTMTQEDVTPGGFREKLFHFTKTSCIMGIALYKLTPLRSTSGSKDDAEGEEIKKRFEEAKRRRAHSLSKIVPKTPLIDYIIKKDEKRKIQLRSLREHIDFFWKIPPIVSAQQTDWPVPGQIAPYD